MDIASEIRKDPENGARILQSEYKAGLTTLARRLCADESDAARNGNDGRWDPTEPAEYGNGGGGAGVGGPGEDSQVLHTQTRNDAYLDGEISLSSAYRRTWGQPGLDGTGSGGGGQGAAGVGGKGGDGVLILRYLADPPGTLILVK